MAKKKPEEIPDPIVEFFVKLVLDQDFRDRFAKGSVKTRRALTKEVPSFKLRKPSAKVLNALLTSNTGPVAVVLGPNQQTAPTNSDAILEALETALATRRMAKQAASKKR